MAVQPWHAKQALARIRSIALDTTLSNKLHVMIIEMLDATESCIDVTEKVEGQVSRDVFTDILAMRLILPLKAQLAASIKTGPAMGNIPNEKSEMEAHKNNGNGNRVQLDGNKNVDAVPAKPDDFGDDDWGDEDFIASGATAEVLAAATSQPTSAASCNGGADEMADEDDWGNDGFLDMAPIRKALVLPSAATRNDGGNGGGSADFGTDDEWGDEGFADEDGLPVALRLPQMTAMPVPAADAGLAMLSQSADVALRPQLLDIRELCTERLVEDANRLKHLEHEVIELRRWKQRVMSGV